MQAGVAAQPTTSDAVLFTGSHRLATHTVPIPPLGPRDLLMRTHLTAISPTRAWPRLIGALAHLPGMAFPLIPGDAAVGTVVATGPAVDPTWHGASVFAGGARTPDGVNAAGGVQQRWFVTSVDATVRIDGLEPERALLIAPLGAASHNLERAGLVAGARLAILGQGVLGQMVARVARSRDAAHITVADASARRLARAVADQAVFIRSLRSVMPAEGIPDIDLLIDTTGDAALVDTWSARVRPGGTLLLLGHYSRLDLASIQGSPGGLRVFFAAVPDTDAYAVAGAMLSHDDFDAACLTSHRFRADRMAQAYAVALGDPDALHVVLAWE